jgi:hypothetical protein
VVEVTGSSPVDGSAVVAVLLDDVGDDVLAVVDVALVVLELVLLLSLSPSVPAGGPAPGSPQPRPTTSATPAHRIGPSLRDAGARRNVRVTGL